MKSVFDFEPAHESGSQEWIALRGMTRENAGSAERLSSIGITAESWGADVRQGFARGDTLGFSSAALPTPAFALTASTAIWAGAPRARLIAMAMRFWNSALPRVQRVAQPVAQ